MVLVLARATEARAQPIQDPSGATPQRQTGAWPQLSDEELFDTPRTRAKPPEPPEPPEPPPPAEPVAPRFGAPGELVITGDSSLGVSSTRYASSDASAFSAAFSPGLDVFVVRGLSLGIDVNLGYSSSKGYGAAGQLVSRTSTTLAGGSRLGFNVPLGDVASWYPRVTVGMESVRVEAHDSDTSRVRPAPVESNLQQPLPLCLRPRPPPPQATFLRRPGSQRASRIRRRAGRAAERRRTNDHLCKSRHRRVVGRLCRGPRRIGAAAAGTGGRESRSRPSLRRAWAMGLHG